MSVGKINVTETLANVEDLLAQDRSLSPAARAMFELLVTIIHLLVAKLGFNSSNSSIPPSQDPRRQRGAKSKSKGRKRKPGGQKGHPGTTLQRYEARQVIDILITKFVIEYWRRDSPRRRRLSIRRPISCRSDTGVPRRCKYADVTMSELLPAHVRL